MLNHFFSSQVFILDAARTPIGSAFKGLKNSSVAQMASVVIKELIRRNKINKYLINQVILGNTVGAGTGQNFARQAALLADLDETVAAYAVNNVCGSGMQAMICGAQAILSGQADLVVAGAAESASQTPFLLEKDDAGQPKSKDKIDSLLHDGLLCKITGKSMGELIESLTKKYSIPRDDQDFYAYESHRKAILAQKQNKFFKEIVPVRLTASRVLEKDERPRQNLKLDTLKSLPSAFREDGSVTAGNSSAPADGASVFLLASKRFLQKEKLKAMGRLSGYVNVFIKPELTFESSAEAIKQLMRKQELTLDKIDLFEIAESFAAQILFTKQQIGIVDNKLNIWGGDIALGHPLGSAGSRAAVTLLYALRDQKLKRGIACVSYGGGGGSAILIENV
jgi:acetyl-CoA C-acetyltransferase